MKTIRTFPVTPLYKCKCNPFRMEFLSDEGYRFDGRKPDEFRMIKGRLGVFDHADGSAILQQVNNRRKLTVLSKFREIQKSLPPFSAQESQKGVNVEKLTRKSA